MAEHGLGYPPGRGECKRSLECRGFIGTMRSDRGNLELRMEENQQPMKSHRIRWVVLLLIAVGGFYVFISSAMEGGVYYLSVEDAKAKPIKANRPIRVKGNVVKGSYKNVEGTKTHHFGIESGTPHVMKVTFVGALPDVFKEGGEVIATGLRGADGVLMATEVSAKCPSKYEGGMSEEARQRLGTN